MLLRHIKLGLVALTALVGATSCLDKYPDSAIPEKDAMQTFADAEQHLIGIYGHLMNSALYSGYLTLLPDIQCDLAYAVEGNSNTYGDFWLWKIRPTDLLIQDVYAQLYAVIGACNFYLDRIDAVMARETSDANLETLDQYTGEVYAIRALCYSELLKCFCEAYDPATAEQQQGVVLRTKYFEKEPVRRASLYDSYKFVLDDLTRADELLDDAGRQVAAGQRDAMIAAGGCRTLRFEAGIPGDVVAAIMAAIYSMGNGKYVLKAVRRGKNGWGKAGVNDTTAPF